MNKEFKKRILSSLIILPIAAFLIKQGSISFILFLCFLLSLTFYEWFKMSKNYLQKFGGLFFLTYSFYTAFQLRDLYGFNFFIFLVLVCIFTDLGGYFFGKFFKGPKLTKISPKKTYSGVIGSFLSPLIFSYIFINFVNQNYSEILNLNLILLVLIISFISQLGDLIISYFKRIAKIKDTGKILPGHGGILDRIDGLIFVLPIIYFLTIL